MSQSEVKNLAEREPFFGQRMFTLQWGKMFGVEEILRELEPLEDAARSRFRESRQPKGSFKSLLSHEEYNKYRRLRRRMAYWEDLGYIEYV